jgi:hypothetical protein
MAIIPELSYRVLVTAFTGSAEASIKRSDYPLVSADKELQNLLAEQGFAKLKAQRTHR